VTYVIGIDPGPVVGFACLWVEGRTLHRAEVAQCTDYVVLRVLGGLWMPRTTILVAERFVVGPRAARSNAPQAGRAARNQLAMIARWAHERDTPYVERNAAEVKPWATDARLEVAGLLAPTKGMRHARDAARHALFAAVKDCGLPDPLSTRGGAP